MRSGPLAMTLIVVMAAMVDIWVGGRPEPRSIPSEAMVKAVDQLKSLHRPGTLVVHSPLFTISELEALKSLAAGPALPSASEFKARRILLLDRADAPMRGFPKETESIDLGSLLVIRVFEPSWQDGQIVMYDLMDAFDASTLVIKDQKGDIVSRCTTNRSPSGYMCPGQPGWLYIAKENLVIGGESRLCVWAHPKSDKKVAFNLPAISQPQEGARLELSLFGGLADSAVSSESHGAAVMTRVIQEDVVRGSLMVRNQKGMQKQVMDIAAGQPTEIEVTTRNDSRRHHCINVVISGVLKEKARVNK